MASPSAASAPGVRRQALLVASGLRPLVLALGLVFPSAAWTAAVDRDFEEKREPESEVQLPPFPQPENLIPFTVSATTNNQFLIDGASLSVSDDGVVRYILVIVSPAGAQNVSYEAIRCQTAERRLYALGRSDQTWARARSDQWTRIRENTLNRHHAALHSEYFCPIGVNLLTPDEIRTTLRRGGHPALGKH